MFCRNCGAENADGAAFCRECGAKLDRSSTVKASDGVMQTGVRQNTGRSTGARIGIIVGALLLTAGIAIAIVAAAGGFGKASDKNRSSWKKTLEEYFDAYKNFDYEKLADMMLPDKVFKRCLDVQDMTKSEFNSMLKEAAEDAKAEYKSDREYKKRRDSAELEVMRSEKLEDGSIKELNEEFRSVMGTPRNYVTDGMVVTIRSRYRENGKEQTSYPTELTLLKIEGKWYVFKDMDTNPIDSIIDMW